MSIKAVENLTRGGFEDNSEIVLIPHKMCVVSTHKDLAEYHNIHFSPFQ